MSLDPRELEKAHQTIRAAAQKHTIEEALHGLAATAAEVVIAGAAAHDRPKLLQTFAMMTLDYVRQGEKSEKGKKVQ